VKELVAGTTIAGVEGQGRGKVRWRSANQYPKLEQQLPHWLPLQVVLPLLGPHIALVDTFEDGDGLEEVLVVDEVALLGLAQVPKPDWQLVPQYAEVEPL
jgi:hypothetical protein